MRSELKLFEEQRVRSVWDEERETWYFSIVDVCQVLTDSSDGRKYWNKLKQRLKEEGNETVTNCHQLKMPAADGKIRLIRLIFLKELLIYLDIIFGIKLNFIT